ncbi:hypothetical protein ECANGB1_634 [Enterospora canceri]|uniref:Uncharacterized protein n=1 Tax=Enterospora canceri TaxID=1081671 RepID=A0A1Y1S7T7_9MICR|nr:hypothetical protein ECANGB1_634 [Enterospora canceri]
MLYFGDTAEWDSEYRAFQRDIMGLVEGSRSTRKEYTNTEVEYSMKLMENNMNADIGSDEFKERMKKDEELLHSVVKHSTEYDIEEVVRLSRLIQDSVTRISVIKRVIGWIKPTRIQLQGYIGELDDFELYEYALENKIEIEAVPGINGLFYEMFRAFNYEKHSHLIQRIEDHAMLEKVFGEKTYNKKLVADYEKLGEKTDLNSKDRVYLALFNLIRGSRIVNEALFGFKLLEKEPTSFNTKVFISLLLAEEFSIRNIVLGIFICRKHYEVLNTDMMVVYMFLLRYMCMYDEVKQIYRRLRVANIQVYNMAYVWRDIQEILKKGSCGFGIFNRFSKLADVDCVVVNDRGVIQKMCYEYAKGGIHSGAYSCYRILVKMNNNNVIENRVGENDTTVFGNMLGSRNSRLFRKRCNLDEFVATRKQRGILTVEGVVAMEVDEAFRNKYIEIGGTRIGREIRKSLVEVERGF